MIRYWTTYRLIYRTIYRTIYRIIYRIVHPPATSSEVLMAGQVLHNLVWAKDKPHFCAAVPSTSRSR